MRITINFGPGVPINAVSDDGREVSIIFLKILISRKRYRVKCELTARLCIGKVMAQARSLINLKVRVAVRLYRMLSFRSVGFTSN